MKARGGNGAVLSGALKEFMVHWEQTAPYWKDEARTAFAKEFLEELVPAIRAASNAAQQIEELLRQVHRDCS